VEELQKQLDESLNVKGSGEEDKKGEKKAKEEPAEVEGEGKYWATHLEYNIDDLLADL